MVPDQVVGQDHAERLVADDGFRAKHGVAEAERLGLRHEDAAHVLRQHVAHRGEQFLLAGLLELVFEFERNVEVIGDRMLVAVRHEHERVCARIDRFVDRILDQRLVEHRQHLLGDDLRRRQETRAETGDGEYDFAQRSIHCYSISRRLRTRINADSRG